MSINSRVNAKESWQLGKLRNKVPHLGSQDYLAGVSSQAELGLRSVTLGAVCGTTSDFYLVTG